MTAMTAERTRRIADARAETVAKLAKAEAYSHEFQKPAQIAFYKAHIEYLDALARGEEVTPPKPVGDWNDTNAVIERRKELAERVARTVTPDTVPPADLP